MQQSEWNEAKWIGANEQIPEGWHLARNEGLIKDHHSHYGRLIVRDEQEQLMLPFGDQR